MLNQASIASVIPSHSGAYTEQGSTGWCSDKDFFHINKNRAIAGNQQLMLAPESQRIKTLNPKPK